MFFIGMFVGALLTAFFLALMQADVCQCYDEFCDCECECCAY